MIKSILVATDGSDFGDVASQYAIYLARELDARLMGLHVLDSRMLDGPLMADISGWLGAQPYGNQVPSFRKLMQEKGEAVMNAFRSRCEEEGVQAEALLKTGHPAQVILQEEARAELIIVGQRGEHAEWVGHMLGSNTERVMRQSTKPCIVTASNFKTISKVLVAFDGSGHASEALSEAAELSACLGVEMIILSVAEEDQIEQAEEVARDGLKLAKDHTSSAVTMVDSGKAEDCILEVADEQACDLIVMGAYGHSHIREMILGSTTAHVIAHTDTPVMFVR